ncbi:hypothetical protein POUND7_009969 [Theobroma cacao]
MYDYELIRFVNVITKGDLSKSDVIIDVYSLKCNSWRRIDGFAFPIRFLDHEWSGTLHVGVIYWNVNYKISLGFKEYQNLLCGILSFHLSSEEFDVINVPNDAVQAHDKTVRVVVLGGCLSFTQNNYGESFKVWKLEKDVTRHSYIRFMTISNLSSPQQGSRFKPIWLFANSEVFFTYGFGVLLVRR